jgi:hypothetical protein
VNWLLSLRGLLQGCHNGCFWMKITVRTSADVVQMSARVRVYPADGFLPSADACVRSRVRTDARSWGGRV